MKKLLLIFMVLGLSACGKDLVQGPAGAPGEQGVAGNPGAQGPQGDPAPTPSVTPEAQEILDITADENNYRTMLGQTQLSTGLSCTLYKITGGTHITGAVDPLTGVTTVASFLLKDSFNQPDSSVNDGLNVLPEALLNNPSYKNLVKLTCTGYVVVTATNYYNFELTSDDGSLLYLDGSLLINNDGNHGANTVNGQKLLRRGVHSIRLDFAQTGAGNQALMLKAGGTIIPASVWLH